ncbi:MAG: hypothetical protein SGILL_000857 [Bacillariaceae sp.]
MSACMLPEDQTVVKSLPGNDKCADCGAPMPTWCSVSYGVLLCLNCAGPHRGMGVHISYVRSLNMDSFADKQVRALKMGGNEQFHAFLKAEGSVAFDAQAREKYDNHVSELYKMKLKARVEGTPEPTALPASSGKPTEKYSDSTTTGAATRVKLPIITNKSKSQPNIFSCCLSATKFALWPMAPIFIDQLIHKNPATTAVSVAGMIGAGAYALITKPPTVLSKAAGSLCVAMTGLVTVATPTLMGHAFSKHRLEAFPSALDDYTNRCLAGRAKRNLGYEVFFPPTVSIGDSVENALVFYPGMLIDHLAYSTVLGNLSDQGILVLLVNAGPSRMCNEVASVEHLKRLQHEISTLMGITVKEWTIGGHSLGGMVAANLTQQRGFPSDITQLVQWAIPGEPCNLFKSKHVLKSVLRISASKDEIVKPFQLGDTHIRDKFPPNCDVQLEMIVGGNHAGFGHYGPQIFPGKDGERGIVLEQQQVKVVQWTSQFIQSRDKKKD